MITTAYINIGNKRVGAIAWNQETRLASFEFEPSFLANARDVAPLKMPIIMDKSGKWKLAPAFDVCHSYRPDSEWVSQHSMSINGKDRPIRAG